MWSYLKDGIFLLRRLPWLFTAMVIYHLAWAVGLYTAFRSLTLPLVKRMPDSGFQSLEFQVLFAEWQFRLYKTDMMGPAIAFVAGLLLLRMMFTPFINAGLYYTFHLAGEPGHDFQRKPFSPFSFRQLKTFLIGLGRVGKPFWLIHLLQWALALLPLWLAMHRIGGLEAVITGAVQLRTITLLVLTYLIYLTILRLLIMYIQFAVVTQSRHTEMVRFFVRRLIKIIGISLMLFALHAILYSSLSLISIVFAGFYGIVFYIVSYGARVFFKMWEISAQYQFYRLSF